MQYEIGLLLYRLLFWGFTLMPFLVFVLPALARAFSRRAQSRVNPSGFVFCREVGAWRLRLELLPQVGK